MPSSTDVFYILEGDPDGTAG